VKCDNCGILTMVPTINEQTVPPPIVTVIAATVLGTEGPASADGGPSPPTCPACGTDDCRRVPLAYEMGTATSHNAGWGVAYTGHGFAPAAFASAGHEQSAFVRRLAPPVRPTPVGSVETLVALGWVFSALGLTFLLIALVIHSSAQESWGVWICLSLFIALAPIGVLCLILGGRSRDAVARRNEQIALAWRRQMDAWLAQYVCLRCGMVWIPR
jgi:hypothetical protein